MKAIKKTIHIRIDYQSTGELAELLDKVYGRVRIGVQHHKDEYLEFHTIFSNFDTSEWRQEEINGEVCLVMPSKMNSNPENHNK